jgi:hypothetical protein
MRSWHQGKNKIDLKDIKSSSPYLRRILGPLRDENKTEGGYLVGNTVIKGSKCLLFFIYFYVKVFIIVFLLYQKEIFSLTTDYTIPGVGAGT